MRAVLEIEEQMITVALPMPPSTNALYSTYKGRRVKSKVARRWAQDAAWQIKIPAGRLRIQGPGAVSLVLPLEMNGDADNRLKAVLDAVVASGVCEDDRHCFGINVERTGESDQAVITLRAA